MVIGMVAQCTSDSLGGEHSREWVRLIFVEFALRCLGSVGYVGSVNFTIDGRGIVVQVENLPKHLNACL